MGKRGGKKMKKELETKGQEGLKFLIIMNSLEKSTNYRN